MKYIKEFYKLTPKPSEERLGKYTHLLINRSDVADIEEIIDDLDPNDAYQSYIATTTAIDYGRQDVLSCLVEKGFVKKNEIPHLKLALKLSWMAKKNQADVESIMNYLTDLESTL